MGLLDGLSKASPRIAGGFMGNCETKHAHRAHAHEVGRSRSRTNHDSDDEDEIPALVAFKAVHGTEPSQSFMKEKRHHRTCAACAKELKKMKAISNRDLALAAHICSTEAVQALLQAKVDPNKVPETPFLRRSTTEIYERGTPLMVATLRNCAPVVMHLIDGRADVNLSGGCAQSGNDIHEAPIYVAAEHNCSDALRVLIEKGGEVNQLSHGGHTAVFVAAHTGSFESLRILLEHGGDHTQTNAYGDSPLFAASEANHRECVEVLLEFKADINQPNDYGETPTFIARKTGSFETLDLLVEQGGSAEISVEMADRKADSMFQTGGCVEEIPCDVKRLFGLM